MLIQFVQSWIEMHGLPQSKQEMLAELNKFFAVLKAEVANETAASFSDLKTAIAEHILLEPLRVILDMGGLVSLNAAEKRNFPAIDLADDVSRQSIQLTATADVNKIRSTVTKFKDHHLDSRFDELFVVLLTHKKNYRTDLSKLTDGRFTFTNNHVLDLSDLFEQASQIEQTIQLRKVVDGLRANLVGGSILDSIRDKATQTDLLHANLLPVDVPETVYTARLQELDRKSIREGHPKRRFRGARDYAVGLLGMTGSRFPRDFICHEDVLMTFRSLDSENLEGIGLIDEGTIEPIDTQSVYEPSLDGEIRFRYLLRVALQYMLYKHQIFWQHEEHMFAFGPTNEEEMAIRAEDWVGKNRSTRIVFRPMERDDPNSSSIYKHFGFRVQFKLIDQDWYLVTEPKWLFTKDGYQKSFAHPKLASSTAQRERNQQIYNHTRFISWYLTTNVRSTGESLKFDKNLVVIGDSLIEDSDWTPNREAD